MGAYQVGPDRFPAHREELLGRPAYGTGQDEVDESDNDSVRIFRSLCAMLTKPWLGNLGLIRRVLADLI